MTLLLRRCMRCRKLYGVRFFRGPWEIATTHGICYPCDRAATVADEETMP